MTLILAKKVSLLRTVGESRAQDSLEDVDVFATDAKKLPKPKPLGLLAASSHVHI